MSQSTFTTLINFLKRIPAINQSIGHGEANGYWWIKLKINIDHPLAWHVVQELGHILNYLSLEERLPTKFYPVSPPPYLNGDPKDYLSWIIENKDPEFTPNMAKSWLEGRLPNPVDSSEEWEEE